MPTLAKDKIIFPLVTTEKEAKIKALLRSISEFMGAHLEPQLQTIITVAIPKDRPDIFIILNRIVLAVKNENSIPDDGPKKPQKETPK